MSKKLNAWTLGGLMVGPILGSGILLLPPLAYARLGAQAVWAWLLVLGLGAAFAVLFIRMTLRVRSDAGIADLVAREWGPAWGELASNYLTGAVVFGAVPVFLTAARLWPRSLSGGWPVEALAALVLVTTAALLLAGLTTVSRLSLVLSSATALALVAGGLTGLVQTPAWTWSTPDPLTPGLGPTLLILFWAVVGWEVIGNYSNDVADPAKTIPRAGAVSLGAVSLVYLVTTLALQTLAPGQGTPPTAATVLGPLLGPAAPLVAGVLAGGLCLTSVLMFVGAVTRMTAQRARAGRLPRWLGEAQAGRTPRRAILVHGGLSAALLGLVALRVVVLEDLVAVANLFFLGNALLGLAAAWKILDDRPSRVAIGVLSLVLVALLSQGQPAGWVLFALVTGGTALQARFSSPPA